MPDIDHFSLIIAAVSVIAGAIAAVTGFGFGIASAAGGLAGAFLLRRFSSGARSSRSGHSF